MFAFGVNNRQLGVNSTQSIFGAPVRIALGTSLPVISKVACANTHSFLFSSTTNRIFAFGTNTLAQLGTSPLSTVLLTPTEATWLYGTVNTPTNVWAGYSQSFAVNAAGIFSFGSVCWRQKAQFFADKKITE